MLMQFLSPHPRMFVITILGIAEEQMFYGVNAIDNKYFTENRMQPEKY